MQGSTVERILLTELPKYQITVPTLPKQRRIASILGTLDDKIELNHKMNKTLEDMAQAIFKSWFIDFDGVNKEDMVESELGLIPRDWKVTPITELVTFNPKNPLKKGTINNHIAMKSLSINSSTINSLEKRVFKGSGSKFQKGDILLARITPCLENGKTALVDKLQTGEIGFGSTEFIVMRGKEPQSKEWVYCLARSDIFRKHAISNMTGTSGRQRVPVSCFEHFYIPTPSKRSVILFEKTTRPLFERISANTKESQLLSSIRDTLLPKLISGEISVPGAEKTAEDAL